LERAFVTNAWKVNWICASHASQALTLKRRSKDTLHNAVSTVVFVFTLGALLAIDPVSRIIAERANRRQRNDPSTSVRDVNRRAFLLGYYLMSCSSVDRPRSREIAVKIALLADSLSIPDSSVSQFRISVLTTCDGADGIHQIRETLNPLAEQLFLLGANTRLYLLLHGEEKRRVGSEIMARAIDISDLDFRLALKNLGLRNAAGVAASFVKGRSDADRFYRELFHTGANLTTYMRHDHDSVESR
jgi:hypothetical protein